MGYPEFREITKEGLDYAGIKNPKCDFCDRKAKIIAKIGVKKYVYLCFKHFKKSIKQLYRQ